jgi:hypothetical protein
MGADLEESKEESPSPLPLFLKLWLEYSVFKTTPWAEWVKKKKKKTLHKMSNHINALQSHSSSFRPQSHC